MSETKTKENRKDNKAFKIVSIHKSRFEIFLLCFDVLPVRAEDRIASGPTGCNRSNLFEVPKDNPELVKEKYTKPKKYCVSVPETLPV